MASRGAVSPCDPGKKDITLAEHQKERRRALQARHRATLAGLFETLKNVVCPTTNKTPAKWKILDHAKGFLREKEAYLNRLLSLKEALLVNDEGPRSLEDVRVQYRKLYSNLISHPTRRKRGCRVRVPDMEEGPESSEEEDSGDEQPQSQSSMLSFPNIQEFEGYLFFYRQTLELLVRSGVLSPDQTGLPVVSEAISGLWSSLPLERRASFQSASLEENPHTWAGPSGEPPCPDTPIDSSQLTSQEASGSSTFEEDLLQDAYDVVQREMDSTSEDSPGLVPPQCGDFEKLREIYTDIMCFIKGQMSEEQEFTQDLCLAADYEELFLRCTESFDEDL